MGIVRTFRIKTYISNTFSEFKKKKKKGSILGFPGGPVVKTPSFQSRRHGFNLWLGKFHMHTV